jgi:hypothetical protein
MLIDQPKKGLWHLLRHATAPAVDQPRADRDIYDDSLPRLKRGSAAQSAVSRRGGAPSWMSPSLILTTARAASGA